MKLSAIVLTKNSERTIAQTLDSLRFCDEIVVIDDYSSDKTLQIASKYKTVIFQRKLQGNFANQRNFGLAKAQNEWVMFVDSDEVVSRQLASEIKKKFSRDNILEWGFYLKRHDVMWGRVLSHGEIASVRLLRIGNKSSGSWKGSVHEIWDIKGKTSDLKNPLLHFPHPSIGEFLSEVNSYTSLRAKELFDTHTLVSSWDIIFYPIGKFFLNYIIRGGFLDGIQGLMFAITMSFHSFLVRAKLWQLYDQEKHKAA